MSSAVPVPTLSTHGYVSDAVTKFDFLISHFYLSDYNQTYLYLGNVSSLPRIIEKNSANTNSNSILSELRSTLETYLSRYYDAVNVSAIIRDVKEATSGITIDISISITDEGTKYSFTRLLESVNGRVQTVAKINNYG